MSTTVAIGALVDDVEAWNPSATPDRTFRYIDLGAIDQGQKRINAIQAIRGREAPSRARQLVAAGDVLVSTVRPNLNAVAHVPSELDGATASTGFSVLRARQDGLDSRYLFHWVRTPGFIAEMTRRATGASYPAVSDRIVRESRIPVPSPMEQRRLADILDRADALRAKRRVAATLVDTLAQAMFVDLFGDPTSNPKAWPKRKLSAMGSLDRGVSRHRPRNAPHLLGGQFPLVQTGDVANCDGYIRTFTSTYSDAGLSQSKMWPAGTLCITIAANIAKTGILTFDSCFPDSVVGFSAAEPATVEFVRVWLSFFQQQLEELAPESAQKNINLATLRDLDIVNPPIELLRQFAESLGRVERVRLTQERSSDGLDELFASLQHRAFRGEL